MINSVNRNFIRIDTILSQICILAEASGAIRSKMISDFSRNSTQQFLPRKLEFRCCVTLAVYHLHTNNNNTDNAEK